MNQIARSARIVVVACLLVTGFGIMPTVRAAPLARAEPPPPSDNVTVVHEGLSYPRGLIFDADGNLYLTHATANYGGPVDPYTSERGAL